jgi:hypothetical protein
VFGIADNTMVPVVEVSIFLVINLFYPMNDRYKKIDEKSKIITDLLGCKIDEGIRELIVLLNYNNIGTTQSCWGHKNWGENFPWFDIDIGYYKNIENIIFDFEIETEHIVCIKKLYISFV